MWFLTGSCEQCDRSRDQDGEWTSEGADEEGVVSDGDRTRDQRGAYSST